MDGIEVENTRIGYKSHYAPAYMILASSASLPLGMLAKTLDRIFPGRGYSPANGLMAELQLTTIFILLYTYRKVNDLEEMDTRTRIYGVRGTPTELFL
jgi:hypothetical protein